MLSKDRCKTTSGFFVIPLLSQLWEEKNYCEIRNELSSWRPVALPNRHKHLCLFKLGYDVHVLLSSVMYILSGKKITTVYPMSRRRWDQNTTQVDNRLNRARATYGRLLHVPPCVFLCLHWRWYFLSMGHRRIVLKCSPFSIKSIYCAIGNKITFLVDWAILKIMLEKPYTIFALKGFHPYFPYIQGVFTQFIDGRMMHIQYLYISRMIVLKIIDDNYCKITKIPL